MLVARAGLQGTGSAAIMATPVTTIKRGDCRTIKPSDAKLSREVSSNQSGLHPRLAETVLRHLHSTFQRPVTEHARCAYDAVRERLRRAPSPLVLDSFCGTGQSSIELARRHPGHLVIGVDQSAHRLGKHRPVDLPNYLLVRAPAEDLWQLLLADSLSVDYHYLLYPNPWPKGKHLQRRIHGHASFARLLRLGGRVELRSNWQLYVEEFGTAMHLAGRRGFVTQVAAENPLTAFERKYRDSGHSLWCFRSVPP
jgi:tRNA G46 methylase TrmB